jgi:hypothetical protein
MNKPAIDITDPDLFGNDAAEDEREDVFNSYVLERPETAQFIDPQRPFRIARAYKGEGKTALLRLARSKVAVGENIVVNALANNIAPQIQAEEFSAWIRGWKVVLLNSIAQETGRRIGFAWRDDAIALVEQAEKSGFRERNVISAIFDRLRPDSFEAGGVRLPSFVKPGVNPEAIEALMQRWAERGPAIWLFVDEIDQNFQNTPVWRSRVASFFVACRELTNTIPELRVRATIRPNVWTTVKLGFDALSHVEQYNSDLVWSEDDSRSLLARRIEGYLRRTGQWEKVQHTLARGPAERERELISMVFQDPMLWGASQRPPHVILYTMSKRRPRWLVELCKQASTTAAASSRSTILRDDISANLASFGRRRIEDMVAEFRAQCAETEELIHAFTREQEQLSTDQLLRIIDNKILTHVDVRINGGRTRPRALEVAAFLFEIGLFFGRRDFPDGSYQHITYSENPALLRTRTNIDAGVSWEIHPVFRQALEIRDASGAEIKRPAQRKKKGRR